MPSENRKARLALAIAPALLVAAAGCQQILGLDQFTKDAAACDGCTTDGGGLDAPDDVAVADVILPDVVNMASSWANGPMPSSPAEVEAGADAATLANFVPVDAGGGDAGVVFDDVGKKLYWNLTTSQQVSDVESAAAYCASLGPAWRLPTRIELVTLLDSTAAKMPYATPAVAPWLMGGRYWTSSYFRPVQPDGLHYWFVDFASGDVTQLSPSPAYVICTSGGA